MLELLDAVEVLCHSSIRIEKDGMVIYFDPFKITKEYHDATYLFITHSHYDHFSEEDILRVKKENTRVIIPNDLLKRTLELGFDKENILTVSPNQSYNFDISFKTVPAYNVGKVFHPKENNWLGYIVYLSDYSYYIAGDTDITEENSKVKCDIAFVPVGGTYTMDFKEAVTLVNIIKPKVAVPTHYGEIVGKRSDGESFKNLLSGIECKVYIK